MDRRDFLRLAAAAAAASPVGACRRGAARASGSARDASAASEVPATRIELPPTAPAPLPPGVPELPIDTIVLLIKENRTYDAIFGDFAGGDGNPAGPTWCPDEFEAEIPHGREVALVPRERHRNCRHRPDDVPNYHLLARTFTLCDRFFSEVRGPSFPNHQMLVSGQYAELDDPPPHVPVAAWRCPRYCYDWVTYPERFAAGGRTWRAYAENAFVPAFHMFRRLARRPQIVSWRELARDAARGTLPNISWVYSERAESEHPPASLCRGEEWTVRQLESLMASPQWPRMAILITWDDWGGIYDHVEPPVIERDARGRPVRFGHRVPCLVVSPFARRGFVYHEPRSFLSLLRFAFEALRVPLPPGRIREEGSMWDCFQAGQSPLPAVGFQHRQCAPG